MFRSIVLLTNFTIYTLVYFDKLNVNDTPFSHILTFMFNYYNSITIKGDLLLLFLGTSSQFNHR